MTAQNSTIRGSRRNRTKEYSAWCNMRNRCLNKTNKNFPRYGGRGITICKEWDSFERFVMDMGKAPSGYRYSLDRKDNDLGYSKDNCRWATPLQQSQNTRKVKCLTHNGLTLCVSEWARRIGIWENAIRQRIARGWPINRILSPRRADQPSFRLSKFS